MERISSTLARANENLRRRVQERALSDVSTAGERQLMRQGSLNTLMRRHDRVRSRHVSGKAGRGGA